MGSLITAYKFIKSNFLIVIGVLTTIIGLLIWAFFRVNFSGMTGNDAESESGKEIDKAIETATQKKTIDSLEKEIKKTKDESKKKDISEKIKSINLKYMSLSALILFSIVPVFSKTTIITDNIIQGLKPQTLYYIDIDAVLVPSDIFGKMADDLELYEAFKKQNVELKKYVDNLEYYKDKSRKLEIKLNRFSRRQKAIIGSSTGIAVGALIGGIVAGVLIARR